MQSLIVFGLVGFILASVSCEEHVCILNKEYSECGNLCQPTCRQLNSAPTICILPCSPGCFCPAGQAQLDNGLCAPIDSEICQAEANHEYCLLNKEFNACGSSCPLRCSEQFNRPLCSTECVPGCYCPDGQALLFNGLCAPLNSPICLLEAARGPARPFFK